MIQQGYRSSDSTLSAVPPLCARIANHPLPQSSCLSTPIYGVCIYVPSYVRVHSFVLVSIHPRPHGNPSPPPLRDTPEGL
jgi:hypothetical protein